jgi:hypothetical protein
MRLVAEVSLLPVQCFRYNYHNYSAQEIAEQAVLAGSEFDDGTALPLNSFKIKLN